ICYFSESQEGGMEFLVDGLNLNKNTKKKLDKVNRINIHLHALFAAVEHGHVDRARTILESTDVDVNRYQHHVLRNLVHIGL
ncbi:unnamed protein product, partial [Timema podura]|nr:unnamed protein product [Timema podura]